MFNILIAKQANGTWNKVAVVKSNQAGRVAIPAKLQGQDGGYVAKKAAEYFAAEPAALDINFAIACSEYRATRF